MESYESLFPIIAKLRHHEPALKSIFQGFCNHLKAQHENDNFIAFEPSDNHDELTINLSSCTLKAIYSYWKFNGSDSLQGNVSFYKQNLLNKNEYEKLYSFFFNHNGLTDIQSSDGIAIYINYDVSALNILLHVITLASHRYKIN
jgi:hypothetical protein